MTDPDEHYGVNLLPALSLALKLYFKNHPKYKGPSALEVSFPAGNHKEKMRSKGDHVIVVLFTKKELWVRARCTYDSECKFNKPRMNAVNREALKSIDWEFLNNRPLFKGMKDLLLRMKLDFVTLVRSINTVCDHFVDIPLTTKWGKTFEKFDDYRRNRWPEEATPNDRPRFLEELLVRVSFWFMSAAAVGALRLKRND